MLPRQQALRCLRGCNSIASLPTGPPNFSGRASHASLAAGPAVFAGQHLYDTCVRAAEMRLGCENALSIQIGVWAANWQSAANRPTAEKAKFESLIGLVFNLLSVKEFDKNRKNLKI